MAEEIAHFPVSVVCIDDLALWEVTRYTAQCISSAVGLVISGKTNHKGMVKIAFLLRKSKRYPRLLGTVERSSDDRTEEAQRT